MDAENLALAQEESTLTKIRTLLNQHKVKLWEPPYYDPEKKAPVEGNLNELAVTLMEDLGLPRPHIFQGLLMLQQNALEKLAARDRFKESGVASFKLRCAKGLKCKVKKVDIELSKLGSDLLAQVASFASIPAAQLKIITGGRVVRPDESLAGQGIKNNSTLMAVKVGVSEASSEAMNVVAEQRKMLDGIKADAARLGEKDATKDDHFLQVADQSGKSVDLPPAERKALIIAMSLHEKGRAALKRRDYPTAIVLLLEAETEFSGCRSDLLNMVDNYAILSLDIAWCYLALNTVSELPMAEERLQVCEQKFKASYGADMERVAALKGSSGNEAALMARLNLVQGIVAFHLGRDREARILLEKCAIQMQMLAVCETDLLDIASMGYSIAEARLGLRAAQGDRKLAVEHIMKKREEKQEIRKKEEEERERGKLRDKLGRCADGNWINIGYYKTLLGMGYTEKVAATALRQANNSIGQAVQLLQEQPDLIQLAAEERSGEGGGEDEMQVNDEDLASLLSLGYDEKMARRALRNEGNVEAAAEALVAGGGHVEEVSDLYGPNLPEGKRRRTQEEKDDRKAYQRISEGISDFEEDHLDLDLVEEGEYLERYLAMLRK